MNENTKIEPRYHVSQTHVWDCWESKEIDFKDMVLGHQCSYDLPERFVPKDEEFIGTYFLNDDKTIRKCSLDEWVMQTRIMRNNDSKHVAKETVNNCFVSTVWLGIDHGGDEDKPLLFETMVFPDTDTIQEEYCDRYSTWDEAVEGHKQAVQWVKDNPFKAISNEPIEHQ